MITVGVYWDRAVQIDRIIFKGWFSNDGQLGFDTREKNLLSLLRTPDIQSPSGQLSYTHAGKKLLESIQLYSGDGLEMAGSQDVTLGWRQYSHW